MYASVRGDEDVFGKKGRIGLSSKQPLEIRTSSADDSSGGAEEPAGGGAGDIGRVVTDTPSETDVTGTETGFPTPVTEYSPEPESKESDGEQTTVIETETQEQSDTNLSTDDQSDSQIETESSDILTPLPCSPTDNPRTAATEPPGHAGFWTLIGLLALLLIDLLTRRNR